MGCPMCHRAALLLSTLTVFLAAAPCASLAGSSDITYEKAGDHWYKEADRGYFRIFSTGEESAIALHTDPSPESTVVKRVQRGDIVVSSGISHWGGAISWRQITSGLNDGWIPEHNLARAMPRLLGSSTIPAAGTCTGHAPVWTATWTEKTVHVSLFPGRTDLGIAAVLATPEQRASMLTASASGMSVDLIVTSEACALVQGQSAAGTRGALIVTDPSGKRLLSGCCQAEPEAFSK